VATVYRHQLFKGYIAQIPGVDGPIRWTYKGMWPELRIKYGKDLESYSSTSEQETYILNTMANMIVKWDIRYPSDHPDESKRGQVVPIDADVIRSDVMVHVRNRIMAISTWQAFSDIDPLVAIEESRKTIDAKSEGKTAAEMFDEVDEEVVKNS
jgi:hypothetical protein